MSRPNWSFQEDFVIKITLLTDCSVSINHLETNDSDEWSRSTLRLRPSVRPGRIAESETGCAHDASRRGLISNPG